MAPFAKGGGPKDRGIFASNRYFHKRRQVRKVRRIRVKTVLRNYYFSSKLGDFAPWRDKFLNPSIFANRANFEM